MYTDMDPAETKKMIKLVLKIAKWSALTLFIIITTASSIKVVGVGEVGVVTRLGNVNREVNSGLMLKMPWGIERLHRFDVKTQKDQAITEAASQDLQDVTATVVTNYHIEQGKIGELFKTVGTDYKARIIDPAIQESFKSSTAKYPVGELITKRADVKETALQALKSRLAPPRDHHRRY